MRIGLAAARGLALALELPVAGVSTLDALAAGAPGAVPVIDARRGEVFVVAGSRGACRPTTLDVGRARAASATGPSATATLFEARRRASSRPTTSELHLPRARFHARSPARSARPSSSSRSTCRAPDAGGRRRDARAPRLELADLTAIEEIERASTRRRGRARCSPASWRSRARSASARSTDDDACSAI